MIVLLVREWKECAVGDVKLYDSVNVSSARIHVLLTWMYWKNVHLNVADITDQQTSEVVKYIVFIVKTNNK